MKLKRTLGYIETPRGRVAITQPAVAETLEQQQEQLANLKKLLDRSNRELDETRRHLAGLQNEWWTRLGEGLGIIKP